MNTYSGGSYNVLSGQVEEDQNYALGGIVPKPGLIKGLGT
jgi:hypothetical protein